MGGTRNITAILVADIVGYSRLAGADEDRTLSRLRGLRSDLIDPAVDAHHGRIVKRTGATLPQASQRSMRRSRGLLGKDPTVSGSAVNHGTARFRHVTPSIARRRGDGAERYRPEPPRQTVLVVTPGSSAT
jgi:hypothetical protein